MLPSFEWPHAHSRAVMDPPRLVTSLCCSSSTTDRYHDMVERSHSMKQEHFQSTSSVSLMPQRQTRVYDAQLTWLYHTTFRLCFPCLTEVQAALSEGSNLSPLPSYQQLLSGGPSVAPPPIPPSPISLQTCTAVGPRASTAFFSPLPLADLTTERRFVLKEAKKKEKCGWRKKRRKKRKKKRPHQQCCQVYNKCASYLSFLLQK